MMSSDEVDYLHAVVTSSSSSSYTPGLYSESLSRTHSHDLISRMDTGQPSCKCDVISRQQCGVYTGS